MSGSRPVAVVNLGAFSGRPLHERATHAADAFRGLAMGLPESAKPRSRERRSLGAHEWMG